MSPTLIETVSASATSTQPYLDEFARLATERVAEPTRVAEMRRRAIERFAAVGFPSTREEEWRFTNVAPIVKASFRPVSNGASGLGLESIAPAVFAGAAARLTFVDSRFAPSLSFVGDLPDGVFVGRLAEAIEAQREEVSEHLGEHCPGDRGDTHAFAALNAALFSDGACILLPRSARIEAPIHLVFVATGGAMSFPRNLIVLGVDAQATVVETYMGIPGSGGASLTVPVTEIVTLADANLRHVKVQREEHDAFHVAAFDLYQERSSRVASHSISLGGGLVRNDLHAVLAGEGADCVLNGLYLVEGRQLVDNHMKVEHAAAHCDSHELYKGVLDGKARAVFNGLIHVHPGAQKTDAKQSNRNLLLSSEAIANSNPQLEIYADDVKCTHGSTVGQLDEDAIFYLRSRGIGLEAAQSLLTYAFASELVERIPVEPVRRALEEFLFARLPGGEVVRQAV
ncbi:MAG TPA: Fe-S cluster assembly protein SufD [Thermoanaerobaculia bacterium]|jgi:Fe-S cluster assembly protein SufD|nr:Fe-S cluster assembly protein SufD [Thermoanaerobaculia bacterium]